MTTTKTYRKLNQQQTEILLSLYKFRFGTRSLIARYQDKSLAYTHYRLTNLLEQQYIGRKYDGKDKLQAKEAIYYLLPKGINFLKQDAKLELNKSVLDLIYKDRAASQQFIDHCLEIFRMYLELVDQRNEEFTFYSKSELAEYNFFPRPLPDGFIRLWDKPYLLELVDSNQGYIQIKRRIGKLIKHFNDEGWNESDEDNPIIIIICNDPYLLKQIQGLSKAQLNKYGVDDLFFTIILREDFASCVSEALLIK
jgi:hypothetical protein